MYDHNDPDNPLNAETPPETVTPTPEAPEDGEPVAPDPQVSPSDGVPPEDIPADSPADEPADAADAAPDTDAGEGTADAQPDPAADSTPNGNG